VDGTDRTHASAEVLEHHDDTTYQLVVKVFNYPTGHEDQWKIMKDDGDKSNLDVSQDEYEQINDHDTINFTYRIGRYFPFDIVIEPKTSINIDVPVEETAPETPAETQEKSEEEVPVPDASTESKPEEEDNDPNDTMNPTVTPHESLETPEPTPLHQEEVTATPEKPAQAEHTEEQKPSDDTTESAN
jgi:hypothetical protein